MKKLSKAARMSQQRTYMLSANASVKMEAQLVDIDFYPRMSDETLAFNATLRLLYGSVVCSYDCHNDGQGGSTTIRPKYSESDPSQTTRYKDALRKWKDYLATLRDDGFYAVAESNGWNLRNDMPLVTKSPESEVDSMLAEWCDQHAL